GPDRAGAGAAHRLRAPRAELPEAAERRSRLRDPGHLHVPVRARPARPQRRAEPGPHAPELHGPPACPARRDRRRCRQQSSAGRGHGRWPRPDRRDERRRRWGADQHELHRRRLLPRDGYRPPAGTRIHERRSRDAEQQRRRQSVGGAQALAEPERRRAAAPIRRQQHHASVHRGRCGRRREAGRLEGGRRGRRLPAADRTHTHGVGDGIAGVRREIVTRGEPRPRSSRARAPDRTRSAGVPRADHGVPGAAVGRATLVHDADAGRRVGPRADPRRLGAVRRAVVRRGGADAGDRRADGPGRDHRRRAAAGGLGRSEGRAGRHRRGRRSGARVHPVPRHPALRRRGRGSRGVRRRVAHDARRGHAGELHAGASCEQREPDRVAPERL
ncbi:MAG: Acidobacterial duplicated orphan permease (function unknown), partial [uncultured Gemmatimonadaceae bacterium]